MPQNLTLYSLFQSIDFEHEKPPISVFESVFTHISYHEEKGNTKDVGNSRWVFLGMYGFKGELARLINQYISGNGKQLQHYLGNIFTNEQLAAIYDKLKLEILIRAGSKFEVGKHKHIFTLGYLGFLVQYATNEYLKKIATQWFIKDLPATVTPKGLNIIQIVKAKAEQVLQSKIKVSHSSHGLGQEILFTTKIVQKDDKIIGEHTSKSGHYAKAKALKLALKYILEKEAESPIYKTIYAKKMAEDTKKEKQAKKHKALNHEKLLQEKAEKRKLKVELRTKEAKEREYKRLLNKKNVKMGEKSVKKTKEVEPLNLSSKKRQRLIDKAK